MANWLFTIFTAQLQLQLLNNFAAEEAVAATRVAVASY